MRRLKCIYNKRKKRFLQFFVTVINHVPSDNSSLITVAYSNLKMKNSVLLFLSKQVLHYCQDRVSKEVFLFFILWFLQIDKLAKDKSFDGKGKIRQLMLIIFFITKNLFVFLSFFAIILNLL